MFLLGGVVCILRRLFISRFFGFKFKEVIKKWH